MTPLPLALAVLLAAGEPASEPPPSPPVAPEAAALGPAPSPPSAPPPFSREYAVQGGWSAVSLAGLGASGPVVRLALSVPRLPNLPGAVLLSTEVFGGETGAGLLVRSISLDVEAWAEAGRTLRLGAGLGLGLVGYRRETSGEWPAMLVPGIRVGAELAVLRWRRGAVVLGAHAAGHLGEELWGSASICVGFRLAAEPSARAKERPGGGAITSE